MAVDREFGVYSWALGVPWNPCNRAVGWRQTMRETVGWAVGPPGRRPAAADGQGSVERAKSLKNQYVLEHFSSKCCFFICVS